MATIRDMAKGRSEVYKIPFQDLHAPYERNVRENTPDYDAYIDQLARSIYSEGVKENLTAYMEDGNPFISNGFSRHAAIARLVAGTLTDAEGNPMKVEPDYLVPVQMEGKNFNPIDRALAMVTRNSGRPLTGLELLKVFKQLKEAGLSNTGIAQRTGFSLPRIGQVFKLDNIPDSVRDAIRANIVSATVATNAVDKYGPEKAAEIIEALWARVEEEGRATDGSRAAVSGTEVDEAANEGGEPAAEPTTPNPSNRDKKIPRQDLEDMLQRLALYSDEFIHALEKDPENVAFMRAELILMLSDVKELGLVKKFKSVTKKAVAAAEKVTSEPVKSEEEA